MSILHSQGSPLASPFILEAPDTAVLPSNLIVHPQNHERQRHRRRRRGPLGQHQRRHMDPDHLVGRLPVCPSVVSTPLGEVMVG